MLTQQLISEAFEEVEAAHEKGYLLSTENAHISYPDKDYLFFAKGKTTHTAFNIESTQTSYRLKAGYSAAEGLETLLTSGETFIECGVAQALLFYVLVLRMMERRWGKIEGRDRFDALFGSKENRVPEYRRLMISPYSTLMDSEFVENNEMIPVQPLSFISELKLLKNKAAIESEVKLGWQVIFGGHPHYHHIHYAESEGAFNCVVSSVKPLKVRTLGFSNELTEEDLYQYHIQAYLKPISQQSLNFINPVLRNRPDFVQFAQTPPKREDIPGFELSVFTLEEAKLQFLIEGDLPKVIYELQTHLTDKMQMCLPEKKGSSMLGRDFVLNVFNEVNTAVKKGILLIPEAAMKKHPLATAESLKSSKTTHTAFETVNYPHMTYRLKPKMSAADALENLLHEGETYIECGVGLAIYYNLLVLRLMEQRWGRADGRKRYDALFGDKDKETPHHRRFIISPFSVVMGTAYFPQLGLLPVQPLSFFIDERDLKDKKNIEKEAKLGWQVMYLGHPDYFRIHPAESEGGFNCVVTSVNPFKLSTVDSFAELDEEGLYQLHKTGYLKTVSFQSFGMIDAAFRNSAEFLKLCKTAPQKERVPGFETVVFAIDEAKLELLVEGDLQLAINAMDKHIEETMKTCLRAKITQDARNLTKAFASLKMDTKPKSEPPVEKEFESLNGLKGLFVSKPAAVSKPAIAPPSPVSKNPAYAGLEGLRGAFSLKK